MANLRAIEYEPGRIRTPPAVFLPTVGLLVTSLALIPLGPFNWWVNWLLIGGFWALIQPVNDIAQRMARTSGNVACLRPSLGWRRHIVSAVKAECHEHDLEGWSYRPFLIVNGVLNLFLWPLFVPLYNYLEFVR